MPTLTVDGSEHVLSCDQGDAIVERLAPKIVIPTHYLDDSTTCTLSTLQPADERVESRKSYRMLDGASPSLAGAELQGMDREFPHFGQHAATAQRRPARAERRSLAHRHGSMSRRGRRQAPSIIAS